MTIEIAQDWFDNNISGQQGYTFESENEVYTKTIPEADLNFEFSTDTDGEFLAVKQKQEKIHLEFSDIILSHTVSVISNGFAIDDATSIRSVIIKGNFQQK